MLMNKRGERVPIILKESLRLSGRESVFKVIDDSEVRMTMFPAAIAGASNDIGHNRFVRNEYISIRALSKSHK